MAGDFYTVLTDIGKQKQATYQAGGPAVELATICAGTGGGDSYYSNYNKAELEALADLVDKVWEEPINHLGVDENNPNWVVTEGVIPVDEGGWMIREVGIKDIDGDLIAVGRFPPTYKPSLNDGAAQDLLIRSISEWGNAEAVALNVDPAIALASRGMVETHVAERIQREDQVTGKHYKLVYVNGYIGTEELSND
ncbi:phage tail protein [Idiomarina sp.]|uniref:phage tail protein n=1 Tax=Idiomarina sp. TaxID=1874361 RepID=UPI003A8F858A